MRKNNQKNIDSLVSKILSETLEEKADNLVSRLKHKEVNELGGMEDGHPKFGDKNFSDMSSDEIVDLLKNYNDEDSEDDSEFDEEINELGGMDDGHPRFGNKSFHKMSSEEIDDLLSNYGGDSDFEDGVDEYSDDENDLEYNDDDFDNELQEDDSEICECGGDMYEGVCNECGGGSYAMMDEEEDFEDEVSDEDSKTCEFHREHFGEDDERTQRFCKSLRESLKGGQKKLDKNKNNKIDAEDFKLLRGKKTETKEGKPDFLDLDKDGDKKEPMKKAAKDAKMKKSKSKIFKKKEVKESEGWMTILNNDDMKEINSTPQPKVERPSANMSISSGFASINLGTLRVENAENLDKVVIPSEYQVNGLVFEIADNNRTAKVRFEEGELIVLADKNKKMINEEASKIMKLMNYNYNTKPAAKSVVNEDVNATLKKMLNEVKGLTKE